MEGALASDGTAEDADGPECMAAVRATEVRLLIVCAAQDFSVL